MTLTLSCDNPPSVKLLDKGVFYLAVLPLFLVFFYAIPTRQTSRGLPLQEHDDSTSGVLREKQTNIS